VTARPLPRSVRTVEEMIDHFSDVGETRGSLRDSTREPASPEVDQRATATASLSPRWLPWRSLPDVMNASMVEQASM